MSDGQDVTAVESCDVLVVGGGPAGVVAAVQAARAGANTLLLEKTGILGGTMTSGGVGRPGLFHVGGRQVIAGIGWELVRRCVETCGEALPDFGRPVLGHWEHQVWVNTAVFAALCDEAVLDAGARLLFHSMPAAVEFVDERWAVSVCTKTGLTRLAARVLIDCTGDANVAALAGAALRVAEPVQPGSLVVRASGYDLAALDLPALNAAFQAAVARGDVLATDAGWSGARPDLGTWLRRHGATANHVGGVNARDSQGKTRLDVEARRALLRLYRFLKTQPGLHRLTIDFMAPECGVRETATVVGDATVTAADYASGRLWPDAVCYACYPIDLHGEGPDGLDCRALGDGLAPTVPRGALLPAGCRNLIVAGRCLSSDRLANSALRAQATCMATGQAAGALAALAAATLTEPREVTQPDLLALLREHRAIVPPAPPD
jgi:hypothetical protein